MKFSIHSNVHRSSESHVDPVRGVNWMPITHVKDTGHDSEKSSFFYVIPPPNYLLFVIYDKLKPPIGIPLSDILPNFFVKHIPTFIRGGLSYILQYQQYKPHTSPILHHYHIYYPPPKTT